MLDGGVVVTSRASEEDIKKGVVHLTVTFNPWWVVIAADAALRVKNVLFDKKGDDDSR